MTINLLVTALQTALLPPYDWHRLRHTLLDEILWVPYVENTTDKLSFSGVCWHDLFGNDVVPAFSTNTLMKQVMGNEVEGESMPAIALFSLLKEQTLWLDPGGLINFILAPITIKHIVQQQASQPEILDGNIKLFVSMIVAPPEGLIQALSEHFNQYPHVRRAYIVNIKEEQNGTEELLVAIEAEGEIEQLVQTTGTIAIDLLAEGESLELCIINANEAGLGHYLTAHFTPFYQKRWGSFLRDTHLSQRII